MKKGAESPKDFSGLTFQVQGQSTGRGPWYGLTPTTWLVLWDIPKTYEKLKRQLTKEAVGNTKLKKLNSIILYKTALILILFQELIP